MTRAKKAEKAAETVVAWKGFDKNLSCIGFQYEIGKTYEHSGQVLACFSGFHACENPLDVWSYYPLENGNRFCRVHLSGEISRHGSDTKIAAGKITVETEVTLDEMIRAAVQYEIKGARAKAGKPSSGHSATNASSGDYARNAATGPHSVIAAAGRNSLAKGVAGVWIALPEYVCIEGEWRCIGFATGQAGHDGVPADVWLKAENGKLVES